MRTLPQQRSCRIAIPPNRSARDRGPQAPINERIRHREVRVIDEEGRQLGIMPPQEALAIAQERGLDLVEVAPQANPPVCRIIDYGKWQYEQKKKQQEAKKKQTIISVKEIKLRPAIGDHDYEFKKNNAIRALEEGDKVKASVRFIGREITHRELGERVLARLEKDLAHVATVEVRPKMEGMTMFVIFAPKK